MQINDDNKNIKTYKDSAIIKRLYNYMKPELGWFILALFLTIITVFVGLLPALVEGKLIGILEMESIAKSDDPQLVSICNFFINNFSYVTLENFRLSISLTLAFMYLIIVLVDAVVLYITTMILQKAGQRTILRIRKETFEHIESLSIAQFTKLPVGKLVTRVTSDINNINELYTTVIVNLIRYSLTLIFVVVMMILLSPQLSIIIAIVAPVLITITILFRYFQRKEHRIVRGCVSNVNTYLSENLSGMKITQVFNQEDKKREEFKKLNDKLTKESVKQIIIFGIFRPLIFFLYIVTRIAVLFFGFGLLTKGQLPLSNYISFYQYIGNFFDPVQNLADQFNSLQQAFASAEKVFSIQDTIPEIIDKKDAIKLDHIDGKIEFDHVWFKYLEDEWILKDVSFTIEAGQTVAFVGATGAGKSTILALICKNYLVNKGEIRIDGYPINDLDTEHLRRCIGQMLQDVFLFSGSIKSNITLRDESFTIDEIKEAATYVNANKIIERLPDSYDYKVMERGANFSAGERQLISFARTVIHKPNVLILDEATANIDTETEVLIQDSLEKMRNIGTMIIVAHRLSTVKNADKIIVLHHGELKEMGSHEELLNRKGMYYNLYELQYKHN